MNIFLLIGGMLSILASIAHIAIIFGGPSWYRFFGAGNQMVQMSEKGLIYPSIITALIAAILFSWGMYAFSAAGIIQKLPFLKTICVTVAAIYTFRGLLILPALFLEQGLKGMNGMENPFWIWSSLISLTIGIIYGIGLLGVWSNIGQM